MHIWLSSGIIIVNLFIEDKRIYQQQKFQAASQDDVHIYEQKEVTVVCEDQEVEEYYKFYIIHV